jgi:hypothetical protein
MEERDNDKVRLVITEPANKPEKKPADPDQQKLRQRSYSNDEVLGSKNKGIWEWTSKLRAGLGGSSEDKQPLPVPAVQALKQTKLMRRRSRSHPTIPAGREQDKPLLSNKMTENRQRSNSELSSVGDDEDLCVEEPASWEWREPHVANNTAVNWKADWIIYFHYIFLSINLKDMKVV